MSSQPLLLSNPTAAKSYVQQKMSPLQRYNIFVDCYNTDTNMIDSNKLQNIHNPSPYNFMFESLVSTRGKIAFLLLSIVPFLDIILFGFCVYYAVVYFRSLKIHERNVQLVSDPFKKMTFDPQMCFSMNCDYYFFNIELKELDGFSLNYKEKMSNMLKLRKERGKTSLMVYNSNFWAHYNHFAHWKSTHIVPLVMNLVLCILVNTLILYLILR